MTLLPKFFVLQHDDGKYLSVRETLLDVKHLTLSARESILRCPPSGFLKFDEEEIWSPRVKFAAEQSERVEGAVHIRSCYTNKYWVAHEFEGRLWISASANKPQEDLASPECTLFRASSSTSSGKLFFELLGVHKSLRPLYVEGGLALDQWDYTSFKAVDWETLVILPSKVAFRSEELDGKYLYSHVDFTRPRYDSMFTSGTDAANIMVAYQLFPTPDGDYRIKSLYHNRFLNLSDDGWIVPQSKDNNPETLFSFVKLAENIVALLSLANNNFCGGVPYSTTTNNLLNAKYPTLTRQTWLIVEERVMKRTISEVRYRLSHSRIYQEKIQEVSNAFAVNNSPDKDSTITLTFTTSDSRTTCWNNSVSVNGGVKVEFENNTIPLIKDGDVQVLAEVGYAHEWGSSKTTSFPREVSYAVVVPPLSKVNVTLVCTKGACDVPFSYTQRDLLPNGKWVTTVKDDGMYTGINSYNFCYQSSLVDS